MVSAATHSRPEKVLGGFQKLRFHRRQDGSPGTTVLDRCGPAPRGKPEAALPRGIARDNRQYGGAMV